MKKIATLLCCLLLTGCVTIPAKRGALNQQLSWQSRQAQLSHLTRWQLNGAVAIETAQHGQSASLIWQQQLQHYQIDLFGPLGAGHVILKSNKQGVTLTSNGKHYQSHTAEALMQQILGWHLPVSNLYFWVRGLPAPRLKYKIKFDAYHHIIELQQQGWHIFYQQYTEVDGIDLPSKLTLQSDNLKVKFIISRWQLKNYK